MTYNDKDYQSCHREAVRKAKLCKCDVGIEKMPDHMNGGVRFSVFLLPREDKRFGHELRCEVVKYSEVQMGLHTWSQLKDE